MITYITLSDNLLRKKLYNKIIDLFKQAIDDFMQIILVGDLNAEPK